MKNALAIEIAGYEMDKIFQLQMSYA